MDIVILIVLISIVIIGLLIIIATRTSVTQISLREINKNLKNLSSRVEELQFELQEKERSGEKAGASKKELVQDTPVIIEQVIEVILEKAAEEEIPAIHPELEMEEAMEDADERMYTEESKPLKKDTDIERFIGENLANKIGIAVLVLGISFFVKYAIDKNWINETGRVVIGLLSGGILIGLAHYIRNNYRSFSSVLIGGGLSVFYFTIAFAFHEYHLIGQQTAFIIMVIISVLAVLLSLYYNRQELAILATIGGFVTPFLVSTGQENYTALFTYLCILNAGLMALSWFKRWPSINIIALFFTTFIYGGWLIKRTLFNDPDTLPYKDALLFASIFYVQFIAMHITNNLRTKRKFVAFDYIIVLSTNFLYYIAALFILANNNEDYKGFFTMALGLFNLLLVVIFYRRKSIDANFVSLLIGLCISFISLTPLVQFKGSHIALFWAAETVVLFWLYQRSGIIHLKIASVIVAALLVPSIAYTWLLVYINNNETIPVIINKGFVTTVAGAVALFIYYFLLRKETEKGFLKEISTQWMKDTTITVAVMIAYAAGAWEIVYQFATRFPELPLYAVYRQAYTFAVAIIVLFSFRNSLRFPLLKFLLTAICFALYLLNTGTNYKVSLELLQSKDSIYFIAHWVAAILLSWLLYDLGHYFSKQSRERWLAYRSTFTWIAAISMILLLSVEMYHVILWTSFRNDNDWVWWENLYYKAGLTILWGICSFIMMWLGMKSGFRTLRIISLSLFTLTLVKLFTYDIRNIPPGGKIAAFILLGVLLLTVSFMYQRLKKIIIDNAGE